MADDSIVLTTLEFQALAEKAEKTKKAGFATLLALIKIKVKRIIHR